VKNKIYIISDVHGCVKTLKALIQKLPSNIKICFVGDLIDRGAYSKDVVDLIISNDYDCVLGNHEAKFIDTLSVLIAGLDNGNKDFQWLENKVRQETLLSYGIHSMKNFTEEKLITIKKHLVFFKSLPLYKEYKEIKTGDNRHLVVSHSHVADKWQYRSWDIDSLEYKVFMKYSLSSRFKNFDNKYIYNVYGHTPLNKPIIDDHKSCIDLGCAFNNKSNLKGYLCALEFPSMHFIKQEHIE